MTVAKDCPSCGGFWPISHFPAFFGNRCRTCRALGPELARLLNALYLAAVEPR